MACQQQSDLCYLSIWDDVGPAYDDAILKLRKNVAPATPECRIIWTGSQLEFRDGAGTLRLTFKDTEITLEGALHVSERFGVCSNKTVHLVNLNAGFNIAEFYVGGTTPELRVEVTSDGVMHWPVSQKPPVWVSNHQALNQTPNHLLRVKDTPTTTQAELWSVIANDKGNAALVLRNGNTGGRAWMMQAGGSSASTFYFVTEDGQGMHTCAEIEADGTFIVTGDVESTAGYMRTKYGTTNPGNDDGVAGALFINTSQSAKLRVKTGASTWGEAALS